MMVESGTGTLGGKDFFAQATLDLNAGGTEGEADAALSALILRYLRHMYDSQGAWPGKDPHDTLRQTCHAVEVLHQLNFDTSTADIVRDAGNWLINLPITYQLSSLLERQTARLYPSRFKTLAYLGRFDDDQVRRDFADLLGRERDGMIRAAPEADVPAAERATAESDVLRTCIALDTLLTLERTGARRALCPDERYDAMVRALREQVRGWQPARSPATGRAAGENHANSASPAPPRAPKAAPSAITNQRDLSYALGLLRHAARRAVTPRQTTLIQSELLGAIRRRDRIRSADLSQVLYAALQLAEHFREDEAVRQELLDLLADVRALYADGELPRRWDLAVHTLVLRLLLTFHGAATLTHGMAARLLTDAERLERITLESDLQAVIRERLSIQLGEIRPLSGGYTGDQILHVPFTYWFHASGRDGDQPSPPPLAAPEASLIVKRSTSSAFHTATDNYGRLSQELHEFFIRQPSKAQIYKSGHTPAFYLPMEDLTDLFTFRDLFDGFDQRAMSAQHTQLLRSACAQITRASFSLFRTTRMGQAGFPGTQIARLYLSRIEGALVEAVKRVPWLKNPLEGYHVSGQRFKGLDHYLGAITKQAHALQPAALGLVHGDFHARNIMLDHRCTAVKLIDLDKLSWSGDYLADLGNLLIDVCIYRRVTEPEREFGVSEADISFVSKSGEPGTAENTVQYPALGRPATLDFQAQVLQAIEPFAREIGDATWKGRLWLAAAAALMIRMGHHAEKEVVAVLYGEAVRLLHELVRSLEQGQPLPDLLVPSAWPEPAAVRAGARGELPDWLVKHEVLRRVHEGLRELGLRAEVDRGTVRYHGARSSDGPVAVLVPARHEGIARLLLRVPHARRLPASTLQIVRSPRMEDTLGTIVIISDGAAPGDVLGFASAGLGG